VRECERFPAHMRGLDALPRRRAAGQAVDAAGRDETRDERGKTMTPEQQALIERAEEWDQETPSPRYRKPSMCGHIRCDCPVNEVHLGDGARVVAYALDIGSELMRNREETRVAAQVDKALALVPALAAELKRAAEENARLRDRLSLAELRTVKLPEGTP